MDTANKYADGRWRFCYYDLDFGGCGGSSEVYTNTIKEDNYNTNGKGLLGQNLKEPMNPALQCFILLMTNQGFREQYKSELAALADTVFEKTAAQKKLDTFRGTYEPLFPQFYTRFFGAEEADGWCESTVYGYASYQSLKDFVTNRGKGIASINSYLDEYYKALNLPDPVDDDGDNNQGNGTGGNGNKQDNTKQPKPSSKKTIKKLSVTAKRGKKTVQVKTLAKAKVTIALNKKIIVKGKKKYKKLTVTASKKGIAKVKLSKKLTKGMKVTVKVQKSGYKTKSKKVKVK